MRAGIADCRERAEIPPEHCGEWNGNIREQAFARVSGPGQTAPGYTGRKSGLIQVSIVSIIILIFGIATYQWLSVQASQNPPTFNPPKNPCFSRFNPRIIYL
jgi:hypothetical protein